MDSAEARAMLAQYVERLRSLTIRVHYSHGTGMWYAVCDQYPAMVCEEYTRETAIAAVPYVLSDVETNR